MKCNFPGEAQGKLCEYEVPIAEHSKVYVEGRQMKIFSKEFTLGQTNA